MQHKSWIEALLPIRGLSFEMRFSEACTPGFFHQAALTAWLRRLLDSPDQYDLYFTLDVLEQGRRHYRAGDFYRFTVFGSGDIGEQWLVRLATLLSGPAVNLRWDAAMPFRNNWRLERLLSWPEGDNITLQQSLPAIDEGVITREVDFLKQQSEISIRLISPWRVLRQKQKKEAARGEMRFCRDADHLHNEAHPTWMIRAGDALRDLTRRRGGNPPARGETQPLTAQADVFWVDASYRDAGGNRKPMGGLLGRIDGIDPASLREEQLQSLLLGQYLGIGQRRAFGYGRYQILDAQGMAMQSRLTAQGILPRALSDENLHQAWASITDDDRRIAEDYSDASDDIADLDESALSGHLEEDKERPASLLKLAGKLAQGSYTAPPLNGFIHEDADGGVRPLAAPPLFDRVLQRAVQQIISPMLDGIMDRGSYGFRAGRSRYQVRDLIQRLHRDGYRWVFESDIRHFFDSVTWIHLENRLQSLLGDDPAVDVILDWMRQPVRWQGQLVARDRGLPQGSPLSPVLANMMLDDFDHDLSDAGCRLIRFADDFVIVAKTRAVAQRGGVLARRALHDVDLELHDDKTRIVPFSEGFRFLGFVFVDGMAVESKPPKAADAGQTPPGSWLARAQRARDSSNGPADDDALRGEDAVALAAFEEANRLLIFCGEPAFIFTRAGHLCIEREDVSLHQVPWAHLDSVILFGRHQITTPALHAALKQHVTVHMANGSGRYLGAVVSGKGGADQAAAWLVQQQCFADSDWSLAAAKSVVDARIRHMEESLRRRQDVFDATTRKSFEQALRSLVSQTSAEQLNGVEGSATRAYFATLGKLVPDEFGFEGRKRRPPPDAFNALLSFGYTLLYAYVDSLLRADGLLPVNGFYHVSHGAHSALASDLMEPFRHVVERQALRMLQGKRLQPEDFTCSDQGCRLSAAARRLYVAGLVEAFLTPVKARGGSEPMSILEHIHRQNLALKFALTGKSGRFAAWRMR